MSKVMLVTGASSGIGAAVAELALVAGWTVGLMARRSEPLAEIAGSFEHAYVLQGDVSLWSSCEGAVRQLVDETGRIDVLFNNAGIFPPPGEIDALELDDWHRAVAVNLTGMVWMAKAVWPVMKGQGGGRIINNGSVSAQAPRAGALAYTVTKHGVSGLTRQLALDGRPHQIACGQIDIGNAQTPLLEDLAAKSADPVPMMALSDAAKAVLAMADLPLEANVLFQTIMATQMPLVGRG